MHSSRMRTAVSPSMHCARGGVSAPQGGCLLPRGGVSAPGVSVPGVSAAGECIPECNGADPP